MDRNIGCGDISGSQARSGWGRVRISGEAAAFRCPIESGRSKAMLGNASRRYIYIGLGFLLAPRPGFLLAPRLRILNQHLHFASAERRR
jgi:hypothetical protein